MSLTSYRAAPPRAKSHVFYSATKGHLRKNPPKLTGHSHVFTRLFHKRSLKTRQRPTLPCLKTKYHRRCKLSRPSSEWDRVGHLRHNHLVIRPRHEKRRHIQDLSGVTQAELCSQSDDCLYARPIKPIEQLVPVSFTHYCASTPGLSTWWSPTVLKRLLVSRGASRLDAFSGYPFRT